MNVLTFLSEFGQGSHYTASFQGAMYKQGIGLPFIEINNQIFENKNVEAAYLSNLVFENFPIGSFHVIAVGTIAHSYDYHIIAQFKGHYFLAANNGVLSLIFGEDYDTYYRIPNLDGITEIHHIYLPVIKEIIAGKSLNDFLTIATTVDKQTLIKPSYVDDELAGCVLCIDNMGNVFTNITRDDVAKYFSNQNFIIMLSRHYELSKIYEDLTGFKSGDIYAYYNARDYLSISLRDGSAQKLLNLRMYKPVIIKKR